MIDADIFRRDLTTIRQARPKASLLWALVLLNLIERDGRPSYLSDLSREHGGDPNSSAVYQVARGLEDLGLATIEGGDRPVGPTGGLIVRYAKAPKRA